MATNGRQLDLPTLEAWLWDAACVIRGPLDAPKFKDYILPLIFLKRLSDVFEDEVQRLGQEFGNPKLAATLIDQDHKLVRLYLPEIARWPAIRQRTTGLGEYLTDVVRAVARENPKLQGVIDVAEFNATTAGQRIVDDGRLASLVEVLSQYRLGLNDVEPDILGRAYEYLLRKFAEGQGQSAGEFYTPREVSILISRIIEPSPGLEVYDPACGSGGLLIKCHLRLLETRGESKNGARRLPPDVAPLKVYGQEINGSTFAMARMNAFIHDMEAEIALGDTMARPAFKDSSGRLRQFDIVVANPMWNQDFPTSTYEHDPFERFRFGVPPGSSADWGWIQHMYASLKDGGRMAVVLDTGSVSRGSGNQASNKEREIRKRFVEAGLVDTVILLPENLFYNTGSPGVIIIFDRARDKSVPVKLINASRLFGKGAPKNFLRDSDIDAIHGAYRSPAEIERLSALVTLEVLRDTDYDLHPARHVPADPEIPFLPISEARSFVNHLQDSIASLRSTRERCLSTLGDIDRAGETPEGWCCQSLESVVATVLSGDWGEDAPENPHGYIKCAVIRGTDFPDVARGRLAQVPERHITLRSFIVRRLREGDLVVEISGGGKYQNTGRCLYVDASLANQADPPVLYSNFTKVLRAKSKTILPKYLYYYWMRLYEIGRTARYEKQPTNIKNFKYKDFLRNEQILFPRSLSLQAAIVSILDALSAELGAQEKLVSSLKGLWSSVLSDLMSGKRYPVDSGQSEQTVGVEKGGS